MFFFVKQSLTCFSRSQFCVCAEIAIMRIIFASRADDRSPEQRLVRLKGSSSRAWAYANRARENPC